MTNKAFDTTTDDIAFELLPLWIDGEHEELALRLRALNSWHRDQAIHQILTTCEQFDEENENTSESESFRAFCASVNR
jgi:hypothetical protein